jgi:hypothetical protein
MGEWINTRDKLPEMIDHYLVYAKHRLGMVIFITKWEGDVFWIDDLHKGTIVTHWMPLPAAPKNGI